MERLLFGIPTVMGELKNRRELSLITLAQLTEYAGTQVMLIIYFLAHKMAQ